MRREFPANRVHIDLRDGLFHESQLEDRIGILVVINGKSNRVAPYSNLLFTQLFEITKVDAVASGFLFGAGREPCGGHRDDFLCAQRLAAANEFLDPFHILAPTRQSALDDRQFSVPADGDVDLTQLFRIIGVGNVIVPSDIVVRAEEQFVDTVDLLFESFRAVHGQTYHTEVTATCHNAPSGRLPLLCAE
jgi:hypothetical protein